VVQWGKVAERTHGGGGLVGRLKGGSKRQWCLQVEVWAVGQGVWWKVNTGEWPNA